MMIEIPAKCINTILRSSGQFSMEKVSPFDDLSQSGHDSADFIIRNERTAWVFQGDGPRKVERTRR